MSRHDRQRLEDILAAIDAIRAHLTRGELSDALVFDAVRVRLIEIGGAAKALPPEVLANEQPVPCSITPPRTDRPTRDYQGAVSLDFTKGGRRRNRTYPFHEIDAVQAYVAPADSVIWFGRRCWYQSRGRLVES